MTKINIITKPDKLFNDNISFLLLYPNNALRTEFQNIIADVDKSLNIYMYDVIESESEIHDIDWLLSILHLSHTVIVDIDNCDPIVRSIMGYIISKPNVYWLTGQENIAYNKISNNRIYALDTVFDMLYDGGIF